MGIITQGSWGNRMITHDSETMRITLLWLKSGERCSWHSHKAQYNKFTVIKGRIGIKTDKGYITELKEQQQFVVEPGLKHEFQVYDDSIVEEIAYVKYDPYDIDRERIGGKLTDQDYQIIQSQIVHEYEL